MLKLDTPHLTVEKILSPATSIYEITIQRNLLNHEERLRKAKCNAHSLSLPLELKLTGHLSKIIILLSQSKSTLHVFVSSEK